MFCMTFRWVDVGLLVWAWSFFGIRIVEEEGLERRLEILDVYEATLLHPSLRSQMRSLRPDD